MDEETHDEVYCAVYQHAIELLGGRWTGAVVRALLGGMTRFNDITAAIPGLSDRMLAERLRELEAEGLLTRDVIPEMPVRVEYHLTQKGAALSSVIDALVVWLTEWADEAPAPVAHAPTA
jgi:DNA-binding HxlR family transcriptional regulator